VLSGLAAITWVIFGVWLAVVLAYYFTVSRRRSRLNDQSAMAEVR
jgi:preprotein translocase subunit SecG